ncbi:MAG TPA: imidazole glycerol phosphate synthase subunit HisH [Dehalococcoidia bacterium]|nr:imidazole glycerol phosphate synthase subunit HisH [Chloroflexota bacterium]HCE76651.1 imidazole glycerol phosphate synthase subunit HisH [Dehalococcoidia bacterium]|tara:strand:+ start:2637 stop:3287 length:651 start_codon:yes stop_codon:yes gene_type:complete
MNDVTAVKPKIAIIDYQAGNIRSVEKALTKSGAEAVVSSIPEVIESCDGVVFPGQGACDSSMLNLRSHFLDQLILQLIANEKPFLGVCLGLQLLLQHSEEGDEECLGLIPGTVRRFPKGNKIPHMGWNEVNIISDHPVLSGVPNNSHFYFVHSYFAQPTDKDMIAATTIYGIEFCSAVAYENVVAVQFHPEKSGTTGLKIYENFVQFTKMSMDDLP